MTTYKLFISSILFYAASMWTHYLFLRLHLQTTSPPECQGETLPPLLATEPSISPWLPPWLELNFLFLLQAISSQLIPPSDWESFHPLLSRLQFGLSHLAWLFGISGNDFQTWPFSWPIFGPRWLGSPTASWSTTNKTFKVAMVKNNNLPSH